MSTLIVLYGRIIQILWFSKDQVENISQRSLKKSRKRITRVVLTVTVILFVCWIPNLLYYNISVFLSLESTFITEDRKKIAPVWFQVSLVLLLLTPASIRSSMHYRTSNFEDAWGGYSVGWEEVTRKITFQMKMSNKAMQFNIDLCLRIAKEMPTISAWTNKDKLKYF